MKKNSEKRQPTTPEVELDVETIADLEVADGDADVIKGGLSTKCPKTHPSGTIIVA